ncbi:hypothetical protein TNCV_1909571 [Trichonephila clavipes]|nr:hypothetical protein TNCV_1909571 [Trichonephila clavipes]
MYSYTFWFVGHLEGWFSTPSQPLDTVRLLKVAVADHANLSSSFIKAMSGSAFGKLKLKIKSPLKIRRDESVSPSVSPDKDSMRIPLFGEHRFIPETNTV